MITIAGTRMPRIVSVGMSTVESKNIGLIYMEILEKRSRVICGLLEAERPVCNVRGMGRTLAAQTRSLAGRVRILATDGRTRSYRVSVATKQHKRRMRGLEHSADSAAEVPDVHRGVSHFVDRSRCGDVSRDAPASHAGDFVHRLSALAGRTGLATRTR